MHCNATVRLLADSKKAFHDGVARRAAVGEEQIFVLEAGPREPRRLVDALVQSHDRRHVVLAEVREVRLGRVLAFTEE